MTPFPNPISLSASPSSFGIPQLKTAVLEPLLVTGAGLLWMTALPIGALFSTAVAAYDKVASLKSTALRMPSLRGNAAIHPLLLPRNGFAPPDPSSRTSERKQVV